MVLQSFERNTANCLPVNMENVWVLLHEHAFVIWIQSSTGTCNYHKLVTFDPPPLPPKIIFNQGK